MLCKRLVLYIRTGYKNTHLAHNRAALWVFSERERMRERERQRERQRDRERDRERDNETEIETEQLSYF